MNFIQKLWSKFVPKKPESSKQAKSVEPIKEAPDLLIPKHESWAYHPDMSSKMRGMANAITRRRKANKVARRQRKLNQGIKHRFAA